MTEPRQIAVVRCYADLLAAARARLNDMQLNYRVADDLAGWTSTYCSKLLALSPAKTLGPMSFDALLGLLAVDLHMIENPVQLAKLKKDYRWALRQVRRPLHAKARIRRPRWLWNAKKAREMAEKRWSNTPVKDRARGARKAVKVRWAKARAGGAGA